MAERVTITCERPSGEVLLEGVLALPDAAGPAHGVVICHPHPAGGGEMGVGLLRVMERRLVAAGFATLRFNFAGVGGSGGMFTEGLEEPADVAAAFGFLRSRPEVDPGAVGLAGWSFGAWMALLALEQGLPAARCVAIAPPLAAYDWRGHVPGIAASGAERHYVVGSVDQFCPQDFLKAFAAAVGEEDERNVMVLPGETHFLHGREDMVAELVAEFLAG